MDMIGKSKLTGFTFLILQLTFLYIFITWGHDKMQPVSGEVVLRETTPNLQIENKTTTDLLAETKTTPYLHEEEIVHVKETVDEKEVEVSLPIDKVLFEYVEVIGGCGPHFEGECLRVRGGPGTDFPVVSRLRNGMVLKVSGKVEREDMVWYKIVFDEWLRYPERITSDWYVSADFVTVLLDEGDKMIGNKGHENTESNKKIIVDRSEQMLTAYNGELVFVEASISTGLALTPTPRGTFKIFKKTPSRYMQGPLPYLSDKQYYDLPGVPWNLYFTELGAVIHGAYWHEKFGAPYSHGCVNLPPEIARKLYQWAELGTSVIVQD